MYKIMDQEYYDKMLNQHILLIIISSWWMFMITSPVAHISSQLTLALNHMHVN